MLTDFDKLWDYQNPAATEEKFRALLAVARESGDWSYLLQLQTQIARAQGLQGKFDECHATLDDVEKQLELHKVSLARVRYLLERGRAFNSQGEPGRAEPLFIQAAELAAASSLWRYAIDAAHMVAIVDPDLNVQIEWGRRALAWIGEHPEQRRWSFAVYNNLGETYRRKGDFENGLECFSKCEELSRGRGDHMFAKKDVAKMLRLLGRREEAMAVIEPVAMELKGKGQSDGFIAAEYGECLLANGRSEEAGRELREAYRLLREERYMIEHEPEELARIKELGERAM